MTLERSRFLLAMALGDGLGLGGGGAFCGTYSHYCFARAIQHADATVVVPMDFLCVPLTALVGWMAYSERLDLFTATGVGLILAGNVPNLLRWPAGGWRVRRKA